jgi:hypothetical protein
LEDELRIDEVERVLELLGGEVGGRSHRRQFWGSPGHRMNKKQLLSLNWDT